MKDETSVTLADSILTKVWEIADSYYPKGDWAHGRSHIERVLRTALEIGNRECADLEIIEISAMLHDIFASREEHFGVEGFRQGIESSLEESSILIAYRLP